MDNGYKAECKNKSQGSGGLVCSLGIPNALPEFLVQVRKDGRLSGSDSWDLTTDGAWPEDLLLPRYPGLSLPYFYGMGGTRANGHQACQGECQVYHRNGKYELCAGPQVSSPSSECVAA
eukprot:1142555-Pelagomonas_calceolata.AAC.3